MINYIKKKLEKRRLKRTFSEYGHTMKSFDLEKTGKVNYAQWNHPFEGEKEITQKQVDFFSELLKDGEFGIDIGAHTGDTTVPMALAAGAGGMVLGLEPNPFVFKILEVNAAQNKDKSNIKPVCYAATDEDGTFTFQYSDASFCNGGYLDHIESTNHKHNFTLDVKGKNLENVLRKEYAIELPKLSLIKVDAEGYDKEILKSLKGIIDEYKPNLLVECYKRLTETERDDLYNTIVDMGYDLYYIDGFKAGNVREKLAKADMSNRKHFEMMAKPIE